MILSILNVFYYDFKLFNCNKKNDVVIKFLKSFVKI